MTEPEIDIENFDESMAISDDPSNGGKDAAGKKTYLCIFILVLLWAMIAVTVGLGISSTRNSSAEADPSKAAVELQDAPSLSPTTPFPAPSMAPSRTPNFPLRPSSSPSVAPTTEHVWNVTLPGFTLQSLLDNETPQSKALFWIFSYVDYRGLPSWRQKQLFALASLYFSWKGEQWGGKWLNGEECMWLDETNTTTTTTNMANIVVPTMNPCNEMGLMQAIQLVGLDLLPRAQPLPSELEFLSHLRSFAVIHSDIYAPLDGILPATFYNLTTLEELVLVDDQFLGSIPTEIGLLTNLQTLYLQENRLSRRIPSELGMLTALEYLDLSSNSLTGPLPSELGRLTSLRMLNVSGNFLSEAVPVEIQTLQTNYSLMDFQA